MTFLVAEGWWEVPVLSLVSVSGMVFVFVFFLVWRASHVQSLECVYFPPVNLRSV